jgi:hypothetical protein
MATDWRILERRDLKAFPSSAVTIILEAMKHGVTGRISSSGHAILRGSGGRTASVSRNVDADYHGLRNARRDVASLFDKRITASSTGPLANNPDLLDLKERLSNDKETTMTVSDEDVSVLLKVCTKCQQSKSASEFYKSSKSPDGLQFWCKMCQNVNRKEAPRKHCTKCGKDKLLKEFGKNRAKSDGLQSHCKKCQNDYQRKYNHRKDQEILKIRREWEAGQAVETKAETPAPQAEEFPAEEQAQAMRLWLSAREILGEDSGEIAALKKELEEVKAERDRLQTKVDQLTDVLTQPN